jgi:hypothetical protein
MIQIHFDFRVNTISKHSLQTFNFVSILSSFDLAMNQNFYYPQIFVAISCFLELSIVSINKIFY